MGHRQVDGAMPEKAESDALPPRSLPRVIGLFVIGFTSLWLASTTTHTVVTETLFPESPPTNYTCRTGTIALFDSVQKARGEAAKTNAPELEALAAFREQLSQVWKQAPTVRALCEENNDNAGLKAFRSVELLRYAEERAVRYGALDLSRVRRLTPELVHALGSENKEK